ncbi:hypothetical protein GGR57DRAFT_150293 [Xylariaceae sp. FL1272]|nr:hypothetical protein GGR57DRAFT_150293 [Xylariaceae sp. FL1272]
MASWPALTTTFSPPAPCTTPYLEGDGIYWLAPRITLSGKSLIQCLPYSKVDIVLGGNAFTYSPGLYCPSGYTTAGTAIVPDTLPGYACCPSKYGYDSIAALCTQSISSGSIYVGDVSNLSGILVTITVTDTTTVTSEGVVTAGAIVLMGQSEKTSSSSATKTSASTSRTSSSTTSIETSTSASSQSVAPSSAPVDAGDDSKSLSSGAKAGIGVGVALAVVLILLVAFCFFRSYRRKKLPQVATGHQDGDGAFSHRQPEDKNQFAYGYGFKPELDATGSQRFELDATTVKPGEVEGASSGRAELSAEQRARELEGQVASNELDAGGEMRR